MAPFLRPFLAVAQTTLRSPVDGQRYPFYGLFTTRPLRRGDFLGFYNGTYKDLDGRDYGGKHDYVFLASNGYFVPRRRRRNGALEVDPERYPMAMLNEPAPGGHANVFALEVTKAAGMIPNLRRSTDVAAIAFFACDDVPAGRELFVHYGPRYYRGHYPNPLGLPNHADLVGARCSKLLKAERQTAEEMCEAFGLHPWVDPECYVLLE